MREYTSTELLIEYYANNSDNFIGQIELSKYDLAILNKLCPPEIKDDFEYCNGAFIERESFLLLQDYVVELKEFSYKDYVYNIITRGIW